MKTKVQFVCRACGHAVPRWIGRCPDCEAWNTMEETRVEKARGGSPAIPVVPRRLGEIQAEAQPRYRTGLPEFDRVLGGGLVPGSLVLVAGDPGVGKSTLLLQVASAYAERGLRVLYVAAEESDRQIRLRSSRLGKIDERIEVLASNRIEAIAAALERDDLDAVIVDSVQTLHGQSDAAPGSITQIRDNALFFLEHAKRTGVPVILVGHVTKEGTVAGPRVMEHMVDVVLYFEGDRFHQFRLLRAEKNRFGPTDEVGVFEMRDAGLVEVANPSQLLLEERRPDASGSAIVVALEGTRPLVLEVQALVANAGFAAPRRVTTGIDARRLAVLLAVLERRAGLRLSSQDVFANVAGGFRVAEPGADLAVTLAVASSYHDRPLDPSLVAMGEVGLGGEIRRVSGLKRRVQEAAKLGFQRALVPASAKADLVDAGLEIVAVSGVEEALDRILGAAPKRLETVEEERA